MQQTIRQMSPGARGLIYLAIAAAATTLWAGALIGLSDDRAGRAPRQPDALADLGRRLVSAEALTIVTRDGETQLAFDDAQGWTIRNRSDYPADAGAVRELMLQLAELEIIAAKTANPDWLPALELGAPETGGDGARIVIHDADGTELVNLIIGKPAAPGGASALDAEPRVYVRFGDAVQAWLAKGDLSAPRSASEWMDLTPPEIAREDIRAVSVRPAAGPAYRAARDAAEDLDFTLEGVPAGRAPSAPSAANGVGFALANLSLTDAARADGLEIAQDAQAVYELFDDTRLTVTAASNEDGYWLLFSAAGGARAEALNARYQGWAFGVSQWTHDKFTSPLEDLLAPLSSGD